MKVSFARLAIGIALAAQALPATAGDFNTGAPGYRGPRGSGTMVPVPVPLPETFSWYIRADVGLGVPQSPTVSEVGRIYGALDSFAPFTTNPSWLQNDFETFVTGGIGVGYYITPRIRADVTVDARTEGAVHGYGRYSYYEYQPAAAPPAYTGNTVFGEVRENVTTRATVGLFNMYYDLTDRGRFTPYIGAGIGFVVHDLERTYFNTEQVVTGTGALAGTRTHSATDKTHGVTFAGMLNAGVAWTLWPSTVLDVNYRYLYLGGTSSGITIDGAASKLSISEMHEHQLRAGLRWNVW
jgi:opacity protein-like surface antigen